MRNVEARVLKFVWDEDPDLAVEAGYIPSRLWEDWSRERLQRVREEAEGLLMDAARANLPQMTAVAAQFHVASTRLSVSAPAVGALNHMTGPVARLSWASDAWPLAADPSCEVYVERLRQFPSYCSALLRCIEEELEPSRNASRTVLSAFIEQIDAFVEAEKSGSGGLFVPLHRALQAGHISTFPASELLERILESLGRLRKVARISMKSAQSTSPLASAVDGAELYSAAIYRGASLPMTPDNIERLGQRILQGSDRRVRQLLDSGHVTMGEPPTGSQLLEEFRTVDAMLKAALPRVTPVQPATGCRVVPMPEAHAAVGPPAYYGPSSARNGRLGSLYVNIAEPVMTRPWEILPLAMHEGVPGHHLQLGLLDENENLPDLVRLLSVNAFTEGWAVYAETLAPVMNIDISPSAEFGLLAYQRWRAARLVVDVGLHVRGWSVGKAARFMSEQTGQDLRAVRREIVRYLAWPGQALGYAVGAHVIAQWIKARMSGGLQLGAAHAELLGLGSVPLSILMPLIDDEHIVS